MRRTILLLTTMAVGVLLASGIALAADLQCVVGRTCFGTFAPDVITGTTTADTIKARAGDDQVSGLGGGDQIFGGADGDFLSGGVGQDTLDGGPNGFTYDWLCGGANNDMLVESLGQDVYTFGGNWGRDLISGGEPFTTAGFGDFVAFHGACFEPAVTTGLTINLARGRAFETSAGSFQLSPNSVSWNPGVIEYVLGGWGNDAVKGNVDENVVNAMAGADYIDVSSDTMWIDFINCGENDGAADIVIKDPWDQILIESCSESWDTVINVP